LLARYKLTKEACLNWLGYAKDAAPLLICIKDESHSTRALANAETVIAEWLETARDLGRPIAEP
jgi:hypothetical protein